MAPLSFDALIDRFLPIPSKYSLQSRSSALSPLEVNNYLHIRTPAEPEQNAPVGKGAYNPNDINNRGIFALFALLAAGLVLTSIWFFFWAKNGGFHFKEGDWEEYKSTVLRRKGPNGTTLSNATKSTELGGGSVVAASEVKEEEDAESLFLKKGKRARKGRRKPRGNKNNDDTDVRAYRHEKPARVGGLNKEPDGSYNTEYTYTATAPSEYSQPTNIPPPPMSEYSEPAPIPDAPSEYIPDLAPSEYTDLTPVPPPVAKPKRARRLFEKTPKLPKTPIRKTKKSNIETPSPASSSRPLFMPGEESVASTPTRGPSRASPRRHTPYRNSHHHSSPSSSHHHQQEQPSNNGYAASNNNYTEPLDFESRYAPTESAGTENHTATTMTSDDRGTKTYFHPIPRLAGSGFRRGGGRRRDSLSDSEGDETVGS